MTQPTLDDIRKLEQRLERGWEMCERETDPRRSDQLERFWLELLRQYEDTVRAYRMPAKERRGLELRAPKSRIA